MAITLALYPSNIGSIPLSGSMKTKIGTLNIDFKRRLNQQKSDINEAIDMGLSVLCIQEARDTVLRQILPPFWATNQNVSSDDKRGSAVCWDTRVWHAGKRPSGLIFGVAGKGINPRWISYQNLKNKETGQVVRFVSLHLPPRRKGLTELQAPMLRVLLNLISTTRRPIAVGGDFNYIIRDDKYRVRSTGLVARSNKIDGFYLDSRLQPGPVKIGPDVNSPHRPVAVNIHV